MKPKRAYRLRYRRTAEYDIPDDIEQLKFFKEALKEWDPNLEESLYSKTKAPPIAINRMLFMAALRDAAYAPVAFGEVFGYHHTALCKTGDKYLDFFFSNQLTKEEVVLYESYRQTIREAFDR